MKIQYLIIILLLNILTRILSDINCTGIHEISFLSKCFCEPGWESEQSQALYEKIITPDDVSIRSNECTIPIFRNGDCECEPLDKERLFLNNNSWFHSDGYRCVGLCRWNSQLGTPISHPNEWRDNQFAKQLPFYHKELPQRRHNHLRYRLDEFVQGFDNFTYLNYYNLGNVIEYGCGGYTQLRNILEHTNNISIDSVTLVDPLIYNYMNIRSCSFSSGTFIINNRTYRTTLSNSTVEDYVITTQYDTVIVMNVLVYAKDAFKFLENVYKSLKPNGLLIFHDRWFTNSVLSSKCKPQGYYTNVIQVSKQLLDHFLSYFDRSPYYSTRQTDGQLVRSKNWCEWTDDEHGFFVAIHKL